MIPFFSHLSDRIGRKRVYLAGAVFTGVIAFPYFTVLAHGDHALVFVAVVVSFVPHALQYGHRRR